MIQYISSQLFHISAQERRLFANFVEELDTKLMPASSVVKNSSHQVLEERLISSTPFMVMKNEQQREWISQPPTDSFKSRTSPLNTIPVVSAIMGRLNHHSIDNGDIKVQTSDFPVEFNPESVTDPDTTPIK